MRKSGMTMLQIIVLVAVLLAMFFIAKIVIGVVKDAL
jgi:hypothetical protein